MKYLLVSITTMRTLAIDGWIRGDVLAAIGLLVALPLGTSGVTASTFQRSLERESTLRIRLVGR